MWINNNFYKYSVAVILVLLIVMLFWQVSGILEPITKFIAIVFFPMLISFFLYYLFRPLVKLVKKTKMPTTIAIFIVFLVLGAVFVIIGISAGSIISEQFSSIMKDFPNMVDAIGQKTYEVTSNKSIKMLLSQNLQKQMTSAAEKVIPFVTGGIFGAINTITSVASILVVVPFMIFYLLKDDRFFYNKLLNLIPLRYRKEASKIFKEADNILSIYIIGQAIIALILGALSYIGFLIIGLRYSFILAFFVLITSFIPLFGSIIGIIPAILVGLTVSPIMALKVIIIMVVIQQVEGNLISPNLVGKRMDIHPLTIIIIFLGAASLYGVTGMIIAVPAYAVIKIFVKGAKRIYKIWKHKIVKV
jgi:predicted PurR-regulated permease PerM